jgi:hypothetical protein
VINARNKTNLAIIIGFLTIPAVLPVLGFTVKVAGTTLRCSGGWFCGLQGIYVAPFIIVAASILAFRLLKLSHPYLVPIASAIFQLMGWFAYARVAPTATVAGVVVMYAFALGSAIFYGLVYVLVNKIWKQKALPVANWHEKPADATLAPASTGANLASAKPASQTNYRRILILLGILAVVAIIAYATIPTLLKQSQRGYKSTPQKQQTALNTKVDPANASKQLLANMPDKQLYSQSTLSCSGTSSCKGATCVLYGTNNSWASVERNLINRMYKNDFQTQRNYDSYPGVNFHLYHGQVGGRLDWGRLDQVYKFPPTCAGSTAITQEKQVSGMDPKTYSLYYSVQLSGLTQLDENYQTSFPGPDPKTFPTPSYPTEAEAGYFSFYNPATNEVSEQSGISLPGGGYQYQTLPMCKSYKVYNDYNQSIQLDGALGHTAEYFLSNGCISIIGADVIRQPQSTTNATIDVTATQADAGASRCVPSGPTLKDLQAWGITVQSAGMLHYGVGAARLDRPTCQGFVVLDETGKTIALQGIGQNDYATVYHNGNFVTKVQITQRRSSISAQ